MSTSVLSYLRQLLPAMESQRPDGELLHRFAVDGDQTAFMELLRRHGPLVWGVCRRVLGDAHAAEDAFQATFLQLAQRAATLRRDGTLSGWLHTVATRLARRADLAERRRRRRERAHRPAVTAADDLTWRELRQMLDVEIARLPEPYRQPLILCYLESRTQDEAARRLGLAPTVLRGRLERGREKLRQRLTKLGLPLAATLLLTRTDPVPAALAETTRQTVAHVLAGGPIPPAVAALMVGSSVFSQSKIAMVALGLLLAGGIGGTTRQAEPSAAPPAAEPPPQARRAVDALGDPLPLGAIRRLGTRRHRVQSWPIPWQDLPDGKSYLVIPGRFQDSKIRRLDAATGRILETWTVPIFHRVAGFSPDGRYALMATEFFFHTGFRAPGQSEEKQEWALILYDLVKRKAVWENREKLEQKDWKHVGEACFSTDGKWISTTGEYASGYLRLWDARTGKEVWSRKQEVEHLQPLGFAEGGAVLAASERNDSSIYLLDRATGKERRRFRTLNQGEARQAGLVPDGSAVLLGWIGRSVRVWDLATGREQTPLDGHQAEARCFAFSPDGKTVVTGGSDSFALVRSWPSGEIVRKLDLGRWGVKRLAVSSDGRRLEVLFEREQLLHFYDLKTSEAMPTPAEGHKGGVWGVASMPDGRLLSFGADAAIRSWNPASGEVVGRLAVERGPNAGGFAVSGDGRLLAIVSEDDHGINVYERATGKRLRQLRAEHNIGEYLAFSPDGLYLAADQRSGGAIEVWDVTSGSTVLRHKSEKASVYQSPCAFSPDGRQFVAADEGAVRFWNTKTWKEEAPLPAYAQHGLAFSPNGRMLAAASVEGVRLFELVSRRERAQLRPEGYPSGGLHFSPSGRRLAWVSNYLTIHVWDVARGELLGSFVGHDDRIHDVAFTADERALVSASADSTLLVWDLAGAAAKRPQPKAGDVNGAWQALAGADAKAAYQAIRVLAASPDEAVPLLARYLKPAEPIDVKRIDVCLRELDSDRFEDRERATRELEKLGDRAAPALERFLTNRPSLEARRRVESLLERTRDVAASPERLRQIRALEALEWMGGDDARRLLEALAKGAPDARLTRDAGAALARMRR